MSSLKRCSVAISLALAGFSLAAAAQDNDTHARDKVQPGEWRAGVPRTAYVNLFEWSWDSVLKECQNELGPKGYKAVQVSPPQEHAVGSQWWRRYQPVSYKIDSRSGNEHQFRQMVHECHKAGVQVYVDTVINHMAAGSGVGSAGSSYSTPNFPAVPYTAAHFHLNPQCDIESGDYDNNRNDVTQCSLPGLPDLDTSNVEVQERIAAYMRNLLKLGVDGFRIDAAKHIKPEELAAIKAKVPGNYFFTQEVIKDGSLYSSGDVNRYPEIGTVNEFSYIYAMKNAFLNMYDFNPSRLPEAFKDWGMYPSDKATVFVNNHDTERKLCDKFAVDSRCDSLNVYNKEKHFLAHVFMLAYPYGYPQVQSGYNFADHDQGPIGQPYKEHDRKPSNCSSDPTAIGKWDCVHRDNRVDNMVGFRNYTNGAPVANWLAEGSNRIAFNRGNKGFVAINNTADHWQKTFDIGLPDGKYCNVIAVEAPESGFCPTAQVNVVNGQATLTVAPNSAVAVHFGATVSAPFSPEDSLNVERDTLITSSAIKVQGKGDASYPIIVQDGEYQIIRDGVASDFTSAAGVVRGGDKVVLRTKSPLTGNTVKFVNLSIGAGKGVWKVVTGGAPCTDTFCPSKTPLDYTPTQITGGKPVTLYYLGTLYKSSNVTMRWGTSGWQNVVDSPMSKRGDGFWAVTITPPNNATALNFVFTDGTNWDNNAGGNWNLPVTPTVDESVTVTFKVTAETRMGESVYIVGNRAEIGNWSATPNDNRKCVATAYPEWSCVIKFATGGTIEYKYQKLGIDTIWENGGNYSYTLPATSSEKVDGAFRN